MRRSTLFAAIILLGVIVAALCSQGQSYKLTKTGSIEATTKKAKVPDSLIKTIDTTHFYKGAKGGTYYWKMSKKTGHPYKCYLPKTK